MFQTSIRRRWVCDGRVLETECRHMLSDKSFRGMDFTNVIKFENPKPEIRSGFLSEFKCEVSEFNAFGSLGRLLV